MTLRLTVDHARWRDHVDGMRRSVPDLIPVVKGNGYGFGRDHLAAEAARWAPEVAVGTLHEVPTAPADDAPADVTWLVLTPAVEVPAGLAGRVVPTVGRLEHVDALTTAGWRGDVSVKLRSSMQRYGAAPDELAALLRAVDGAGYGVHAFVVHPPLATDPAAETANVDEIVAWAEALPAGGTPLSVSHVGTAAYLALRARFPHRGWRLRCGTALWHGDKAAVTLTADVLDVRQVRAGDVAGYRRVEVPFDGHLVMVGAGSSHGIAPLADGRSPFHFARRRLALLEAPHMHTSMVLVPAGEPAPGLGDRIDVQRPLVVTQVDETRWA